MTARTVTWLPGLFHMTVMSKAASSRALSARRQVGEDVAGVGDLIQQGGVHRRGDGGLEGGELGFGLGALGVQFGEPVADPGAHRGGGRAVGDVFQRPDLRVLLAVQLLDGGLAGRRFRRRGGRRRRRRWRAAGRRGTRRGQGRRCGRGRTSQPSPPAGARGPGRCGDDRGRRRGGGGCRAGAGTGSRRRRGRGRWRCRSSAAGRSCTGPGTGTGSTGRSAAARPGCGRGWCRARPRCPGRRARWRGR